MTHPSNATREQRRWLERENLKWPAHLVEIPRTDWPPAVLSLRQVPDRVWRSRDFLVQEFLHPCGPIVARLSLCRTKVLNGEWQEGIAWEELQRIKLEVGYSDFDAVEIFPREEDVVNVANLRHLWVVRQPLIFAWRPGG